MKHIPLAKPEFDEREVQAVRAVLESGWVVQGPEVEAFEGAIAQLHQARHCIAVTSGTAALHVCYLALGIGAGDAVFVPSFAWPSAANLAMVVGARPVFVDVLPDTYNIDPADLEKQIKRCRDCAWGKPRAVVPVHQFGLAADMNAILHIAERHGLDVIEDAACALGATYGGTPVGTFGKMGIFSFHPRKAVTTGEGGAIVTNDDALAQNCRMLRNHGQVQVDGKRDFHLPGLNYRMTEIQAAIGRVQLDKFPGILSKRRPLAERYLRALADRRGITLPSASAEHTWQTFMVVLSSRLDARLIASNLASSGIGVGPGSVAAHGMSVYQESYGYKGTDLRQSSRLEESGMALPVYSTMTDEDLDRCVESVRIHCRLEYLN